jgi:SAM-dependent methyltransferase
LIGILRKYREAVRQLRRRRDIAAITDLLSEQTEPDTTRSESEFDVLHRNYVRNSSYGYDRSSLFQRAASRGMEILRVEDAGDKRLKILELGAGDGMLGVLLAAAGHDVTLCDLEDWRVDAAKSVAFVAADCCAGVPFDSGTFDVVCSYNSFEHFADPQQAFGEALRVTKAGGLLHLKFGPLYCSPYGLHAWSLKIPYPQFLLSPEFIDAKLRQFGIHDLGKQLSEPQSLNKWRLSQFVQLWDRSECRTINYQHICDESHLNLVWRYPEAFRGRGLTFEDLTCTDLCVTIRKMEAHTAAHIG